MASKEEILQTVLTVLDKLVEIEARLNRIEVQVTPKLTIEASGYPACGHACGVPKECKEIYEAYQCNCMNPYHKAYKTP